MVDAWVFYVIAALVLVGVVVLLAVLLNVHKMLARITTIRREVEGMKDSGASSHLVEAVTQLQSVAVSMDRIAARCDSIEKRIDELAQRAPASASADMSGVTAALRDALSGLQGPVAQIRDSLARSEVERIGDEVRRCLYARGFDGVTVLTDLASVPRTGEARVQVEVVREGVKSKGWVLVRDGAAVESKISPTYEMFP
jgi:hypothetical protein